MREKLLSYFLGFFFLLSTSQCFAEELPFESDCHCYEPFNEELDAKSDYYFPHCVYTWPVNKLESKWDECINKRYLFGIVKAGECYFDGYDALHKQFYAKSQELKKE